MRNPSRSDLRWNNPLRADEVEALIANVRHPFINVAAQSLRALVRLALTPNAWRYTTSAALALLARRSEADDLTHAKILESASRIPAPSVRAILVDRLNEHLGDDSRRELLDALTRVEEARVIPYLFDELRASSPERRMAAARNLSNFPSIDRLRLVSHLQGEVEPPVRFWLTVALAICGDVAPLLAFFYEPRPRRWYFWGDVIGSEGAAEHVLYHRAQRLPEDARRAVAALPIHRADDAYDLVRTIGLFEPSATPSSWAWVPPSPALNAPELEAVVYRWIHSMPDWQKDAQFCIDHHLDFSPVDPVLRGRAVGALFAHQYEYLRRGPTREPFLHGSPEDGYATAVSDGGEIMANLVGRLIGGAVGIDVGQLFRLYCEEQRDHVYTSIQLVAAASYSSPREVILATRPAMQSADPSLRTLAAEFVEWARRYVGDGIPTWGGGGPPSDTVPSGAVDESVVPETLQYDPRLVLPQEASPGGVVHIIVDLLKAAGPNADVRISAVVPGWDALAVEVALVGEGITFLPGTDVGVVVLHSDGSSVAFEVDGFVARDASKNALGVTALFSFRGRSCGWARGYVGSKDEGPRLPFSPNEAPGRIGIDVEAEAPSLTVSFVRKSSDDYCYSVSVPEEFEGVEGMPTSRYGSCTLSSAELLQIWNVLEHVADAPDAKRARSELNGVADLIYDILPPVVKEAYRALLRAVGDGFPIQFVTEDPGFPWELGRPEMSGKRTNLLCETHPVARWHWYRRNSLRSKLGRRGRVVTVAPEYQDDPLPRAQEEAAWLVAEAGARRLKPATCDAFVRTLQGTDQLALLHVAGHGEFKRATPLLSSMDLEDGAVTASEIRGEKKSSLEAALVFLNVCEAGASVKHVGGAVVGLVDAFAERGAAAVIAPLWAVGDGTALTLIKSFVPRMLSGKPLARVLRDARYSDIGTVDPLAYVFYGDVMASFA